MLITKPRPQGNIDPLCYAVEGYDGYPTVGRFGEVNTLLNFDETFGPVLEFVLNITNFKGTPTLAVRVPSYQKRIPRRKISLDTWITRENLYNRWEARPSRGIPKI